MPFASRFFLLFLFLILACNSYSPTVPSHITQGGAKVKVKKAVPNTTSVSKSHQKFGQALRHLDLEAAAALADQPLKKEILKAFQYFAKGDQRAMLRQIRFLIEESRDEHAQALATQLRNHIFYLNSQWQKLKELSPQNKMMAAFARKPAEEIHIKEGLTSGKLKLSATGCPIIEVKVNGKKEWFWFDTGASESVVSSDLVEPLSVTYLSGEIDIKSSTSNVKTSFGYIKSFEIGSLHLKNHQVFILDRSSLEFKLHDGSDLKIRGIIGWSAIRHLRWELDYGGKVFNSQPSKSQSTENHNFLWMGYPLVRLNHKNGTPLLFGLDTGSNKTSFLMPLFNRVSFRRVREREVVIGGAGGYESIPSKIVSKLPLQIGDYLFALEEVQMEQENHTFFLQLDGTLGSDISLGSRMILDFPKGKFLIIPPHPN